MSGTQVISKGLEVGHDWPVLTKKPIDEVQVVRYAGASGDFNPLHYVESIAHSAGFDQLIAHGMLVMGFLSQAVAGWIPNSSLRNVKVRFVNVTKLGDIISIVGKIVEIRDQGSEKIMVSEVKAIDQNGQEKITGFFEAVLSETNN